MEGLHVSQHEPQRFIQIEMEFAPIAGGYIDRPAGVPSTTQTMRIETPYGTYCAFVRCTGPRQEQFLIENISEIPGPRRSR